MTRYRLPLILLSFAICALTGCSSGLRTTRLPEAFTVKDITKADASTPFAVSSGGVYAAISEGNLKLFNASGIGKNIATGTPTAISFSADGKKLAAAFPSGKKTVLRIFDSEGKAINEASIPARVTSIAWRSEKQILATTLDIRRYTFGSSLASTLYSWDGAAPPAATELKTVTVRPGISKLPDDTLFDTLNMTISPYGDEIAYSTLKDPPLFNPYLSIATRHIESGAEHEIGITTIGSGGPIYTPDGENVIVGDQQSLTRKLTLPDGKEANAWPAPGTYPAISRSGDYLYLDGSLYKDGREIASFPKEARGTFLPDGSGLALSYQGKVYVVSGLNDKPAPPLPANLERLLQLRRLRSLGLISEKEFQSQKDKAVAPKE